MAKQMLEIKSTVSKLVGIFEKVDGQDVVIVDEQVFAFDDIKEAFYGGEIKLDSIELSNVQFKEV